MEQATTTEQFAEVIHVRDEQNPSFYLTCFPEQMLNE